MQTNQPADLVARIKKLERELAEVRRLFSPSGVRLRDGTGNLLLAAGGEGLAAPFLPIAFTSSTLAAPADTTTNATFDDLQSARWLPQHARLYVRVLARASDGSTTGEIQVTVDGLPLTAVQAVTVGMYDYLDFGPAALPIAYTHLTAVDVAVQGRRTAGGGTIGARVVAAYGEG